MKSKIITVLTLALLLSCLWGCSFFGMEEKLDAAEDALENVLQTGSMGAATETIAQGRLTRQQAQDIALEQAGFTEDQVTYLRTEFEIDDGIPRYEVTFHQGQWEYDYEINADTGAILSYDRDD